MYLLILLARHCLSLKSLPGISQKRGLFSFGLLGDYAKVYTIHMADFQIKIVCEKCFKKIKQAGIKCYKCEENIENGNKGFQPLAGNEINQQKEKLKCARKI